MINRLFENKWAVSLFALLMSLLLVAFVYAENNDKGLGYQSNVSEISTETIDNVPIKVIGATEDMYITGLPESVSVELKGPQSILSQTIEAQDFEVVTEDLSQLEVGEHYIQFEINNLSKQINYTIRPTRVPVVIERQASITREVTIDENQISAADGEVISDITLNPSQVEIYGAESTINRIARVYVSPANDFSGLTGNKTVSKQVIVEDNEGNKLDVSINPKLIDVSVSLENQTANLPLSLNQVGAGTPGKTYQLTAEPNTISVTGPGSLLSQLTSYSLDVNIADISNTTIQNINIPLLEGITSIEPQSVRVRIEVQDVADRGTNLETTQETNAETTELRLTTPVTEKETSAETTPEEPAAEENTVQESNRPSEARQADQASQTTEEN